MKTLKHRLQHLEQHAYWRWLERYLRSLTTEELYRLYGALESVPNEVEAEELNRLLQECQQR
jgi:hypothetical protein